MRAPLGWLQLRHRPLRLLVALLGIGIAVLLMLMQLGFRQALFDSAVRFHERYVYDIALFSPKSVFIVGPKEFSIRRLYQALGHPDVVGGTPIYIDPASFKNPWNHDQRAINAIGFDPDKAVLKTPGFEENRALLRKHNTVIMDAASRPEFGPPEGALREALDASLPMETEINDRKVQIVGLFEVGTSFGIDGTVMTSVDTWLWLFPEHRRDEINLGLLRLRPGSDPVQVREQLKAALPKDVLVLTKADFIEREKQYWNSATPIGYIFAFGTLMGLVVGAIVVYQVLFSDVTDHLPEYGTMRAIGYSNAFVSGIVLQQALILAVLGFFPGLAIANWAYQVAASGTQLPLYLTHSRVVLVFLLTVSMCAFSGFAAIRRVRRLDPAQIFS